MLVEVAALREAGREARRGVEEAQQHAEAQEAAVNELRSELMRPQLVARAPPLVHHASFTAICGGGAEKQRSCWRG